VELNSSITPLFFVNPVRCGPAEAIFERSVNKLTLFEGNIKKQHLYPFLYGISTIVDECKLHIQSDGIYVKEVNAANVCMVDAELPEHIFESGSYQIKEPVVVGLDIREYIRIFTDDSSDDDVFSLSLFEPVGECMPKLRTVIEGQNIFFGDVRYNHTTLKIESIRKSPKIPDIIKDLPLEITMPLEFLKRGVQAAHNIGGVFVYIGMNFNNPETAPVLFITNFNDAMAISCTKISAHHLPGFEYHDKYGDHPYPTGISVIQTMYSIEYIEDIVNGFSKYGPDKNIKLNLGTDWPGIFSRDLTDKGPELKYMLAPRIEY